MPLIPVGSTDSIATTFNNGVLSIGGVVLGEITNIALEMNQGAIKYFTLNKRIASKIRAGNYEFSGSFDIEGGVYRKLIALFNSSSSPVTDGLDYSQVDAQPDAFVCTITTYEDADTTKPIQYQLQNTILTSISPSLEQESFGKMSVTVECTAITTFVDDTVS